METVASVTAFLDRFAPAHLAAEWDNIGLLLGDSRAEVQRVMTCLSVTPATLSEAVDEGADLLVTHHPFPFRPLKKITTDSTVGTLLLRAVQSSIAIYSPHTAFDSAATGINQRLAEGLQLARIRPLLPFDNSQNEGTGRMGIAVDSLDLNGLAQKVKDFLVLDHVQLVGPSSSPLRSVAVACGSAGELITSAHNQGCDCLVLGEARFHACLEAESLGMCLVLAGHYATERFAVDELAKNLGHEFPDIVAWPSRRECDPIRLG